MKKNIITCSLILSALLLTACKPPEDTTNKSNTSTEKIASPMDSLESKELISSDGKIKIKLEDFAFRNVLNNADFIAENVPKNVDIKEILLFQQSNDGVLLSVVKSPKIETLTKESIEKKLKENNSLQDVLVQNNSPKSPDSSQKPSISYHYNITEKDIDFNESCSILAGGYAVCASGDKNFVLLDRLVNAAEIVDEKSKTVVDDE